MEAVSGLLNRVGYELGRNELVEHLRSERISIGNDEIKGILDALVSSGFISYRKDGQKYLYGHQSEFFANDVKAWSPNV